MSIVGEWSDWPFFDDDDDSELCVRAAWLHALVRPVDEYHAHVRSYDMGRPAEVVDVDANYFDSGDRRLALLWPSGTLLWLPVDDVERVTDERWGDR